MTGKIAVGLHMSLISGPGSLAISDAERTSIVSAVTVRYHFWTGMALEYYANLQFHLIYTHLTVFTLDITGTCNGWDCDEGFTNDALKLMGYQSGDAGEDDLAKFYKLIYLVLMVHTWFSLRNTNCIIHFMLLGGMDQFTCKSVMD